MRAAHSRVSPAIRTHANHANLLANWPARAPITMILLPDCAGRREESESGLVLLGTVPARTRNGLVTPLPPTPPVPGDLLLLFLDGTKSQQEPPRKPARDPPQIRASPQEIPHKSQQAHKYGCFRTLLLPWRGVPPTWWYIDCPPSILVGQLGFVGDLLWTCADLWGISCGLAGGSCWDFMSSKNSSEGSPPEYGDHLKE